MVWLSDVPCATGRLDLGWPFRLRSAEETALRYEICSGEQRWLLLRQIRRRKMLDLPAVQSRKKRGMLIKNKAALKTEQRLR